MQIKWEIWIIKGLDDASIEPYRALSTAAENLYAETPKKAAEEYYRRVIEEGAGGWAGRWPSEIEVRAMKPESKRFIYKPPSKGEVIEV